MLENVMVRLALIGSVLLASSAPELDTAKNALHLNLNGTERPQELPQLPSSPDQAHSAPALASSPDQAHSAGDQLAWIVAALQSDNQVLKMQVADLQAFCQGLAARVVQLETWEHTVQAPVPGSDQAPSASAPAPVALPEPLPAELPAAPQELPQELPQEIPGEPVVIEAPAPQAPSDQPLAGNLPA